MNDSSDYLWDGTGTPDPFVASLERSLAPLRHTREAPPPRDESLGPPIPITRSRSRWTAAAGVAAMLAMAFLMARGHESASLTLTSVEGAPRIDSAAASDRLPVGRWLRTDSSSSAEIKVADIGRVLVKPDSELRVRKTGPDQHLLELQRGSIHARIIAPPRVFLVDTPSARATDMGCEYTLDVDETGAGILRVQLGHVLLERHGRSADVPMLGGTCRMRPGFGPGTPYFDDAAPELIAALDRFDFGGGRDGDLDVVLTSARARDALSLWHLIARTNSNARQRVVDRLMALKPLPPSVTREEVMRLSESALSAWWEHMRPF